MKCIAFAIIMMLAGCTAVSTGYMGSGGMPLNQALPVIEQAFMEQHPSNRPQSVEFTINYLYLYFRSAPHLASNTIATTGNGAIHIVEQSSLHTPQNGMRIYYNSIGDVEVFTKKGRYIIQIRDIAGRVIRNVAAITEERARTFANAIASLSTFKAKEKKPQHQQKSVTLTDLSTLPPYPKPSSIH